MRIRFYSRTQAMCLALSLFLAVFVLGLALGFAIAGLWPPAKGAVEAFAPLDAMPTATATPDATPVPSSLTAQINLFAAATSSPSIITLPSNTPLLSDTPLPSLTPVPSVPPTPQPGEFRIEVVRGPGLLGAGGGKRILIYHTHTYEAYESTPENTYEPTQQWRTKDNQHNVVRVGDELTRLLTAAGYDVVHDTTAYAPPVLDTSYTRSLKMLEDSVSRGEKYNLYIDLHRDAYSSSMANQNTVQVGDLKIARIMMLIGRGMGQSYEIRPEWEKNLVIAQAVTDSLNEQIPDLCRPVRLKTGRFNQHIAPCCILVEVGNNKNTLEEALASIPYLADAIGAALSVSPPEQ